MGKKPTSCRETSVFRTVLFGRTSLIFYAEVSEDAATWAVCGGGVCARGGAACVFVLVSAARMLDGASNWPRAAV